MKIFALAGTTLAATVPYAEQWQGVNVQGNAWSATVGPDGVAYQENGFSIVAKPGAVTTDSSGISTYCVEGQECDTQITAYQGYVWDSDNESLSATGLDNVSKTNFMSSCFQPWLSLAHLHCLES